MNTCKMNTCTMNRDNACLLLNINGYFNIHILRKKYKHACLKNHPDKNGTNESFILIKEAYDFLLDDLKNNTLLNHFDNDTLQFYVSLLNLFKENILENYIIDPIINHLKSFDYYELYPTIDQLFNKSLYKLDIHYIPLWHNEIDIEQYKIKIVPDIPDYIDIDNNNNIHVYVSISSYPKTFTLGKVSFLIIEYTSELFFIKQGIPLINEKNIYDISILSDVIFHIT